MGFEIPNWRDGNGSVSETLRIGIERGGEGV